MLQNLIKHMLIKLHFNSQAIQNLWLSLSENLVSVAYQNMYIENINEYITFMVGVGLVLGSKNMQFHILLKHKHHFK